MAAGGFKTFVAGETLDQDEINNYLMQGMLVFADSTARDAAITSPVEGQFAFLKSDDKVYFYDSSAWVEFSAGGVAVEYVVIGGGGAGGYSINFAGGGGSSGGYRCNVVGENSGGNSSAEPAMSLLAGAYSLIVGAGATGATPRYAIAAHGSVSKLGSVLALGGGPGATLDYVSGYSAGGASASALAERTGGIGISFMSSAGGDAFNTTASNSSAGGGGGAGAVGADAPTQLVAGDGGAGLASSITGSSVTRAGGGAGGSYYTGGTGGAGGGGAGGSANGVGTAGTANTGGGGGGSASRAAFYAGSNGGSGVVIFGVPTGTSVTFSGGVTQTSATVGANTVYTVTATSTTSETVTFA